jgi:predicted lipoprotein with Yx(FWY)xxD motif
MSRSTKKRLERSGVTNAVPPVLRRRKGRRFVEITLSGVVLALLSPATSVQSSSASTSTRADVAVLSTSSYGKVLVVGNGALKGFPLYTFSGDAGGKIRCGTAPATGYDLGPDVNMPLTCTGPERDLLDGVKSDDWPAFTTVGRPLAGAGVSSRLLGTIVRSGIGTQVTYAGHPLYLFDPVSKPFIPQGEGYMETVKPLAPWHGYWFLVSATGNDAPGRATLEEETLPNESKVLSVVMDANVSPLNVTVYSFRRYQPRVSDCDSECSLTWIPVLTSSTPLSGRDVNPRLVGTTRLPNGTEQVIYGGQPLFLYAKEKVFLTPAIHLKSSGTAGNGNGVPTPGGGAFVTIPLH